MQTLRQADETQTITMKTLLNALRKTSARVLAVPCGLLQPSRSVDPNISFAEVEWVMGKAGTRRHKV